MNITNKEWNDLEKFHSYGGLKVKEKLLLKWYYLSADDKKILDYLFEKPYINNSGQPIDKLFVDDEISGVVMHYFDKSVSFRDAYSFPLDLKIRACLDIDNQLKTLHKYGVCFNDVHIDNFLIDEESGHLVDFESVTFLDEDYSLVRYYLRYDEEKGFDVSKNGDNYKALISYFSLIYGIDIEELFGKDRILYISLLDNFFKNTSISNMVSVVNKNMLLDCPIPNIVDFLPFISDEERVNYDINILKDNVKTLR